MPWIGTKFPQGSDYNIRETQVAYHDYRLIRIPGFLVQEGPMPLTGTRPHPRSDYGTRVAQAAYLDHRLTGIPGAGRPDALD
ncbi:hypothetical protein QYF36_009529 [Acer negundo]|nr:hypothetical protein QYF36_009529 [Acer negundo]